jgi:O-antigen ligase
MNTLSTRSKIIWVYLISTLFIALNLFLVVKHSILWGAVTPVLLIILILYFVSIDKIILLITLATPLAINIRNLDMGFGISIPTEPLMLGVLIFFFIKVIFEGKYEIKVLKHPLTILIFLNLIWLLFTSITSELPVVSFKFLLARLWFLIPFYFMVVLMFKKMHTIRQFLWLYVFALVIVIFYTLINHAKWGFSEEAGHWVMTPFYNDHTAYGAILAMYIPVVFGLFVNKHYGTGTRILTFVILTILVVALFFSYSRAAWLSLALGLSVFILVMLKIKFQWVFVTSTVVIVLFFTFQQQIFDKLEKNKQDSSANVVEHIQSMTNISSDASNLERINRWQSALRMFSERPFWGWGPGTYQFLYAPYQRSKERTIISTNAGDLGNAHSEYISPMAESGVFGFLTTFLIFVYSIYTGLMLYKRTNNKEIKIISLSVVIGLLTYYLHGFLNNFLNSDKASVPVWGFMAILVALEIFHNNNEKESSLHQNKIQD